MQSARVVPALDPGKQRRPGLGLGLPTAPIDQLAFERGKRIVMLHSFMKKSNKTPHRELEIAETRLKELKHANS